MRYDASTELVVGSTARFVYEFGYHQIFVEDVMSSTSEEHHNVAIGHAFNRMGRVRSP